MTQAAGDNPLLGIELPIPWHRIRAEHIESAVRAHMDAAQGALDSISKRTNDAPYEATFGALDTATLGLDYALSLASHLESVQSDDALRKAYGAAQEASSALYASIATNGPLFQALRAFAEGPGAKTLSAPKLRYVQKTIDDFRRNGAELEPGPKKALLDADVELARLTLQFAQNVLDSTNAFEIVIDDVSRLAGVPQAVVDAARESAKSKGLSGYRLTLQGPSYIPILTYAHDRALREALYRANVTRSATGGATDNRQLISQILALRRTKARTLGFAHFGDLVTADRMVGSAKVAMAFVDKLKDALLPAFKRENQELAEFAARAAKPVPEGSLRPWDIAYYAEALRKERYDLDDEALRPYFGLRNVQDCLFAVARSLFGLRIEPNPNAPVWDKTVTAWDVRDQDGTMLGGFYLDLFPRESKRDGAWMGGFVDKVGAPNLANIAVVVANVTPPKHEGDDPTLTHREVETLFHEFGHMLHHVLSNVEVRSLSGTRVVADFVELPSKIMENWCWEPEALALFAKHQKTGAPMPADLIQRMERARSFRAANFMMRQIGFSSVDLLLHTSFEPGHQDLMAYARDVFQEFSPVPLPDDYAMIASFSHLFGGSYSYAAGYYSYQWAELLDADAFGAFKASGVLDASTGARFRSTILSQGDSDDPKALYRTFMGRDADITAMLKRLGVG
jgi:oligopeptidase A